MPKTSLRLLNEGPGRVSRSSEEDIELGLTCLARNSGNFSKASRECDIPRQTLQGWAKKFHERYLEIQEEVVPLIRARTAERALQIAEQAADLESKALTQLEGELPNLEGRDLANALRNVSTTKGISLTHANNFQSPAERPQEQLDPAAILAGLQRLGVATLVDSTATEEPPADAEVVQEG